MPKACLLLTSLKIEVTFYSNSMAGIRFSYANGGLALRLFLVISRSDRQRESHGCSHIVRAGRVYIHFALHEPFYGLVVWLLDSHRQAAKKGLLAY